VERGLLRFATEPAERLSLDAAAEMLRSGSDRASGLTIDTVLVYSTYFGVSNGGGYGGDYAAAIAVDSSGSTYITG
jgi:hypothetical protein